MLGVDEFRALFIGPAEFQLRVRPSVSALTREQRDLARRVARHLRFGLETGDPSVVRLAADLEQSLSGRVDSARELEPPERFGRARASLALELEERLMSGRILVEQLPLQSLSARERPFEFSLPRLPSAVQVRVIALPLDHSHPQVRMVGALPRVRLARLKGMFFDTNKSFLLPASVAVFDRLLELYRENDPSELLIVGHTDTTADARINDPLSLERAENTRAFLEDDVDAWLAMYEQKIPEPRRWGETEDDAMLFSVPDFEDKPEDEDPLLWFQRTRGLAVDGKAGPITRRQLIKEYMALDSTSLGSGDFDIKITTHGCGENFPLDESGESVDAAPEDGKEDQQDRRVELFFFDREFGIVPPPPGKNSGAGSTQYPEWRRRAELAAVFVEGTGVVEVAFFNEKGEPIADERFEVVLPDGRLKRGRLDGAGRAKISGIASADCKIRFPDLGNRERVPPAAIVA